MLEIPPCFHGEQKTNGPITLETTSISSMCQADTWPHLLWPAPHRHHRQTDTSSVCVLNDDTHSTQERTVSNLDSAQIEHLLTVIRICRPNIYSMIHLTGMWVKQVLKEEFSNCREAKVQSRNLQELNCSHLVGGINTGRLCSTFSCTRPQSALLIFLDTQWDF